MVHNNMDRFHPRIGAWVTMCVGIQLFACDTSETGTSGSEVRTTDTGSVDTAHSEAGSGAATSEDPAMSTVSGEDAASAVPSVSADDAMEAAVGELDDACPNVYDLPRYDGDVVGLCAPAESTQCQCPPFSELALSVVPQCTPDGSACVLLGAFCTSEPSECGWNAVAPACPELATAFDAAVDDVAKLCASDEDCREGHYCDQRVGNRMFCDDVFVARAEELCPSLRLDGGGVEGSD